LISNFLANSPMTWLNFKLSPYAARMGIIPETQVATQPGVQTHDLMSFLSGLKAWSHHTKTSLYLLKRNQMKGFNYLAPQGFYDACTAYGLPQTVADLDRAAQLSTRCFPQTAFGIADPIIVDGVTKQGGPMSPFKATITTSLGHRYLDNLASLDPDCIVIRSTSKMVNNPHLPDDAASLRFTMAEATDDSYIAALTFPALRRFTLAMEHFQFFNFLRTQVDDPKNRYLELVDIIDSFSFPAFAFRSPFTLLCKIISQNVVSRCHALLSLQPILHNDVIHLDQRIMKCMHDILGFLFCPSSWVSTLPLALGSFDFPSLARINTGIAIDGLAWDINHHIPAYRTMALITLADWTCQINRCIYPLDHEGLSRSFTCFLGSIPAAWIIAQDQMSKLGLSLRQTDQSHLLDGHCSISHALSLIKWLVPQAEHPNGHAIWSLRSMGFHLLSHIGGWAINSSRGSQLWGTDGSMVPASAGLLDDKSVTSAITGPHTMVMRLLGCNISILHGELVGIIGGLILSDPLDDSTLIYTDHLNSTRLIDDSQ
ncbi:hypothetical protein L208DRAFT_1203923, partial [Tricholoma matsutake]